MAAATTRLPKVLSVALWASPLVAIGAYLAQAAFRFPPQTKGAGVTALTFVLGLVLSGMTTLFGFYQLARKSDAWTIKSGSLLAVNVVLLLLALAVVTRLFR